jgi:hypothetical protein
MLYPAASLGGFLFEVPIIADQVAYMSPDRPLVSQIVRDPGLIRIAMLL